MFSYYIVPLDMKGCIPYTKYQIRPVISKGTKPHLICSQSLMSDLSVNKLNNLVCKSMPDSRKKRTKWGIGVSRVADILWYHYHDYT